MSFATWRWSVPVWLAMALACETPRPLPSALSAKSPVIAKGDDLVVTVDEVTAIARANHVSAKEALETALAFELLAQEALRSGIVLAAEDRARIRQVLVQRFLIKEIEPELAPAKIKESDVRALYETGRGQFVHPRLVKVALLAVFTGVRMKPAARARQEETARAVAAAVTAQAGDGSADLFGKLGHEPAWVERQVSFSEIWQAADGDHPYPLVFGRAVAALHRTGDTTPLVCEESGCYLGRFMEERPAANIPFQAVASSLRDQMAGPWQRQRFSEIVAHLAGPHDIAAEPALLREVAIDPEGF